MAEPSLEGLVAEGRELVAELVGEVVGVGAVVGARGEGAARGRGAAGRGRAARGGRIERLVHHVRRALGPVLLWKERNKLVSVDGK